MSTFTRRVERRDRFPYQIFWFDIVDFFGWVVEYLEFEISWDLAIRGFGLRLLLTTPPHTVQRREYVIDTKVLV